jgi:P4 family phage/plasmid primase-like protien
METDTQTPAAPVLGAAMRVSYYSDSRRYSVPPAWKPTQPPPPSGVYLVAPFRELIRRDYRDTPAEVWLYPLHSEGGPFTRPSKQATPELIESELQTVLKGAAIMADIDDEPAHSEGRHSTPAFFEALEQALERFKSFAGWFFYRTLRGARVGAILETPADLDTYQEARNELYELISEAITHVEGAELDRKCRDLGRGFAAPYTNKRGEPISPERAQLWVHPQNTPAGHVENLAQRWRARQATLSANSGREPTREGAPRERGRSASPNSPQDTPKTRKHKAPSTYIPAREHRTELTNPELYQLTRSAFAKVCSLTGDEAIRREMLMLLDRHIMDGRRMEKEGPAWFDRALEEFGGAFPAQSAAASKDAPPPPQAIAGHPELKPLKRVFVQGDDLELGEAIIEVFGDSPAPLWHGDGLRRYDPARGTWRHYGPHALKRIAATARGAVIQRGENLKDFPVSHAQATAALKWVASIAGADSPETAFDLAPRGVVLAGGVFVYADRERLKVEPAAPHHYATHALEVPLEGEARRYFESNGAEGTAPARPPVFTGRFLGASLEREPDEASGETPADVAAEIEKKIITIGEWLGLALLGLCTREAVALVVHGEGSNGKSVLTSLVADLFGPDQTAHLAPQAMREKFSRAQLFGASINVVSEMPESDLLASDTLKAVISGDKIEVERKHQDPFSFKPRAGHIFAANKLPASRDRSHGLWRRLVPIKFNRVFTRANRDPYLGEALRAELPQLVLWCLDLARGYLERGGFAHPDLISAERWAWREITDSVAAHYREALEHVDDHREGDTTQELWEAFRAWGEKVGLEGARKMSLVAYTQHLYSLPGVTKKRVMIAGTVRTRANLKLKLTSTSTSHSWP